MIAEVSVAGQMAALVFVVLAFLLGIGVLVGGQLVYNRSRREHERTRRRY